MNLGVVNVGVDEQLTQVCGETRFMEPLMVVYAKKKPCKNGTQTIVEAMEEGKFVYSSSGGPVWSSQRAGG